MFDEGSAFGQSYNFFEGRADGLDDPSGAADFASSASTVCLYEDVGPVVVEGLLFAVGVVVDVDVVVEDVVAYFVWIGLASLFVQDMGSSVGLLLILPISFQVWSLWAILRKAGRRRGSSLTACPLRISWRPWLSVLSLMLLVSCCQVRSSSPSIVFFLLGVVGVGGG